MQGISARACLVCWINPTSSVPTPVIYDLRTRACDAVVAILRLGRSLALPTRETSFLNIVIGCFHAHATPRGTLNARFVPESRTAI